MPEMQGRGSGGQGQWGGGQQGGGNWNQGRDNDRDWGRDGRGGGQDWDRGGGRGGGRDNDWDRGRRDNDWNRGWDGRGGGWDNDWWDDWYRPKKHKRRRYNYYPGNPAWWYPYWNQWVAPVLNPIVSWFQPNPYGTYPGGIPSIIYP